MPIEIVLETLRPFVEQGQIRWLGLSECSAATLRRAKAVPGVGEKIVAVQMEYSPFDLEIEGNGLLETARELGVAVVAYSPLGRGLLTGKYVSLSRQQIIVLNAGDSLDIARGKISRTVITDGRCPAFQRRISQRTSRWWTTSKKSRTNTTRRRAKSR